MDNEHAVIIYFYYGKDSLSELHQLENKLRAIIDDADIVIAKRIGITKSVDLPWRFYIKDNPYISRK